jgi:hypothetical protein
LKEKGRYYIGTMQPETPFCDMGCMGEPQNNALDSTKEHKKGWYYVDENGVKSDKEVAKELWLTDEPNNEGPMPPEPMATLERLSDTELGFNDVNGEFQNFHILCEYRKNFFSYAYTYVCSINCSGSDRK